MKPNKPTGHFLTFGFFCIIFQFQLFSDVFYVNTTADTSSCTKRSCSLRGAVISANSSQGSDEIHFNINGQFNLNNQCAGVDSEHCGDLDISNYSDISIVGNGQNATIISGVSLSRIFEVQNNSSTLSVSNVSLINGYDFSGGAIRNLGKLTVEGCSFYGNVSSTSGGAIYSYGSYNINSNVNLTVFNTNFEYNSSSGNGAAILCEGVEICEILDSGFRFNGSDGFGGAVYSNASALNINKSYFIDNHGDDDGGAIFVSRSEFNIVNTTISENTTHYGSGSGISILHASSSRIPRPFGNIEYTTIRTDTIYYEDQSSSSIKPVNISRSIIEPLWSFTSPFQGDQIASSGYNVVSQNNNNGLLTTPTDVVGQDPQLLNPFSVTLYGTENVFQIDKYSPAFDLIPSHKCIGNVSPQQFYDTDQRGYSRLNGNGCDAGAYEQH